MPPRRNPTDNACRRSRDMCNGKAGIIDQLLELSRGRLAIAELQIGETTDVGGVNIVEGLREGQIVLGSPAEKINGGRRRVLLPPHPPPHTGAEAILNSPVFL